MQVDSNKQVVVSDSGHVVFQPIKTGNGNFSVSANVGNTGDAVVSPGSITNITAFQTHDFTINSTAPNTHYVINNTTAMTLITRATYTPGAQIAFNSLETSISGTPQTGDQFFVRASFRYVRRDIQVNPRTLNLAAAFVSATRPASIAAHH